VRLDASIDHPTVVTFRGWVPPETGGATQPAIVTELMARGSLLITPSLPIYARFLPFLMATNSGLSLRDFVADAITRDYVSELPTDIFTGPVPISDLPAPLFQRLVPVMPEQSFCL
jgi:hypothetical protein